MNKVLTFAFLLLLGVLPSRAQGPFCPDCTTIQLEHITKADYDVWLANVFYPYIYSIEANYTELDAKINEVVSTANWSTFDLSHYWFENGYITQEGLDRVIYLNNQMKSSAESALLYASNMMSDLQTLEFSVTTVAFSNSTFCVTCIAEGGGGVISECGLCPACEGYLYECASYLGSIKSVSEMQLSALNDMKNTVNAWYVKWQAQDEKLQPLIDELKPMLANIKNYYDDYYASDWTSATWNNQKTIYDKMIELNIIPRFGRFVGDYYDSSFNAGSWSALSASVIAFDNVLNSNDGAGKNGFRNLLTDYNESFSKPFGDIGDIQDASISDYEALNWFQKVAVALGRLAFSTNAVVPVNQTDTDAWLSKMTDTSKTDGKIQELSNGFSQCGVAVSSMTSSMLSVMPSSNLPEKLTIFESKAFKTKSSNKTMFTIGKCEFILAPWLPVFNVMRAGFGLLIYILAALFIYFYVRYVLYTIYLFTVFICRCVADLGTKVHSFDPPSTPLLKDSSVDLY
jgi:hypothetical protein